MENGEPNIGRTVFPETGDSVPEAPASPEPPIRFASRVPAWMYLVFVLFIIVGGYCIYLQKQIVNFDREIKKLQKDASSLSNDLRFQTNAYELERGKMNGEIDTLKVKLANAEKSVSVTLDKASKDAITKLEEERVYWRGEVERVISYYQKQSKSLKTPPPAKTIRK